MEKYKKIIRIGTAVLFVLYLIVLVWIILFKMHFSLGDMAAVRSLNLVPFYYKDPAPAGFQAMEVSLNILIFVPFGLYLSMLAPAMSIEGKIALISGTSLALEAAQFILSVGCSDITDVVTNTLGGILGIFAYVLARAIFRNRMKINAAITVVAANVTTFFLGYMAVLYVVQ